MQIFKNKFVPTPPYKQGFTLAEVLITLVIIGVIAALTVPSLINKTNNQEMVARLKKTYSTLAQATNLIIAEEGTPRADKGGWATTRSNIYNLYLKHLNNARECKTDAGCWASGNVYTTLSGAPYTDINTYGTYGKFVLSDGVAVSVYDSVYEACNYNWDNGHDDCALIMVDLNGAKKPNRIGRDVFEFVIKENGLKPLGCNGGATWAICSKDYGGEGCACKVLREGAMNY
ncbi:prepilin-type N-terminal cleavage/methylation domain-containing protein [bacterium]|nr:prepilin-type N-terminal cleavage/methylation domain-containing protein [bacterium]